MNFIPDTNTPRGSYLCTWSRQAETAGRTGLTGKGGSDARDALTPELLFGSEQYYHFLPGELRGGLFFLLDDGWDVPVGTANLPGLSPSPFGSLAPDAERFGSLGDTPVKRLSALNRMARDFGYAGLGVWVSPQRAMEEGNSSAEEARDYWAQRAGWCREAGVRYWKVDWGKRDGDLAYRRMMTEAAREYAPELRVEHAFVQQPLSCLTDPERRRAWSREALAFSDYFRTYDVMWPFEESAALARIDELLSDPLPSECGAQGILNAESLPFIAAGLGCSLGVMGPDVRIGAVLRWQRLAPPFGVHAAPYLRSDKRLTDSFYYPKDPCGWVHVAGSTVSETAPAVMARGCRLPVVDAQGREAPFVLACRSPETGCAALASIRRTIGQNPSVICPADVAWETDADTVGIFGYFSSLRLIRPAPIPRESRFFLQNLTENEAREVTEQVSIDGCSVTLDGRLLADIGSCDFRSRGRMYDLTLLLHEETNASRL